MDKLPRIIPQAFLENTYVEFECPNGHKSIYCLEWGEDLYCMECLKERLARAGVLIPVKENIVNTIKKDL